MYKSRNYKMPSILEPKVLLIIALLVSLLWIIMINPGSSGNTPVEIEDKCGRFVNLVSHSIPNEEACETRCKSQCIARSERYRRSEFANKEPSCNSCLCYCR
jgi:hypothetical protein